MYFPSEHGREQFKAALKESHFTLAFIVVLSLFLTFLFREFLFSNQMLNSGDVISLGLFFRTFIRDAIFRTGSIPEWNSLQCCGLPFVDAIHGGALYPFTYLEIALGIHRGFGFSFIFHFLLAGTLAYWGARQLGIGRIGAAFVGVSYGLAPCLISWVAPGHDGKLYVACWFPAIVGLAERIYQSGRLRDVALLGFVVGLTILTAHLQLAYYTLWFLAGFTLLRSLCDESGVDLTQLKSKLLRTGFIVGGLVLGVTIASIQIIPSAQYILGETSRAALYRGPEFAGQFALKSEELISFAVPEFSGTNLRDGNRNYWGKNSFKDNSEGLSALAVFLAFLCLFLPSRRMKWFWFATVVLTLLYAVGNATPVFRLLLALVPSLDSMEAPSGASFIAVFALTVLAGMTIDQVQNPVTMSNLRKYLFTRAATIPIVIAILLAVSFYFGAESTLKHYARFLYPEIVPTGPESNVIWNRAVENLPSLVSGIFTAATTITLGGILILFVCLRKKCIWLLWSLPLIAAFTSIQFNQRFITTLDPTERFSVYADMKMLMSNKEQWRSMEYDIGEGVLHLATAGISSPTGIQDRIPAAYFELIGRDSRVNARNPRLINLTGTRYLVASSQSNIASAEFGSLPFDTLLTKENTLLLENRNCFPRVFLAQQFLVLPSDSIIRDSILSGTTDLRSVVLLRETPSITISQATGESGTATIEYYEHDSISIATGVATNSLLVLTDNFHSSWKVFIDGREGTLLRAYTTFRAVEIPAGTRNVVFVSRSATLFTGKLVSTLGLLVLIALLAVDFSTRKRRILPSGN